VGLYAILIFVIVALEELMDTTTFDSVSVDLSWLELAILIIFILEIMIGLFAWGIKVTV
jgi:3',5'-cyclic-nucleotide phosphodiesterase/calcium/calmodulin-dependent 3',5'-cyclic nucleotide phosphodiesterase